MFQPKLQHFSPNISQRCGCVWHPLPAARGRAEHPPPRSPPEANRFPVSFACPFSPGNEKWNDSHKASFMVSSKGSPRLIPKLRGFRTENQQVGFPSGQGDVTHQNAKAPRRSSGRPSKLPGHQSKERRRRHPWPPRAAHPSACPETWHSGPHQK